jgi:ribonuclease P protein component
MTAMSGSAPSPKIRFRLPREQRLRGRTRFDELFSRGKRRTAHPLTVHAMRREDDKLSKFGISIGRRCGTAVRRNLIKRRIREAFRLMQHEVPPGFDFLLVIKPHEPMTLSGYQGKLRQLIQACASAG